MEQKGFVKYILIIAVILAAAVLSQQPFVKQWGQKAVSKAPAPVQTYLTKGSTWVNGQVLPKIGGEVQKRGEMIKNEVSQEKEKISENILEKVKNYFTGIENSIIHPGTCQPSQTPSESPKP